jgi:IS30 family transposase
MTAKNTLHSGEVLVIKRHWSAGQSIAKIASEVGRSKDTVIRHVCQSMRLSKAQVIEQNRNRVSH